MLKQSLGTAHDGSQHKYGTSIHISLFKTRPINIRYYLTDIRDELSGKTLCFNVRGMQMHSVKTRLRDSTVLRSLSHDSFRTVESRSLVIRFTSISCCKLLQSRNFRQTFLTCNKSKLHILSNRNKQPIRLSK
jgi:hypothetical protein